jgi:hypothetical protein
MAKEKTCCHGLPGLHASTKKCVQCGRSVGDMDVLHCLGSLDSPEHEHELTLVRWDDNADRTRTLIRCRTCGIEWYGCKAKRLGEPSSDGDTRGAWGPVGVQTWSKLPVLTIDSPGHQEKADVFAESLQTAVHVDMLEKGILR